MNDLIVVEKKNALAVFTEAGLIEPLLQKVAVEARKHTASLATAKSRAEIASLAYKIAQSKTYLDGVGKDLVADMKELPKKVDATRKLAREFLDALRDEVRAPLDAWEVEQERLAAVKKAEAEAAALAVRVEHDHEVALLLNAEFDRQQEERERQEIEARAERDRRIAEMATQRAAAEAERKMEAIRKELVAAEMRAVQEKQAAEAREEMVRKQAVEAERQRVAKARVDADERVRDAAHDLLVALQDLVDSVVVQEADCRCHLSPPCNDCVENGGMRELITNAKEAIAKATGGAA